VLLCLCARKTGASEPHCNREKYSLTVSLDMCLHKAMKYTGCIMNFEQGIWSIEILSVIAFRSKGSEKQCAVSDALSAGRLLVCDIFRNEHLLKIWRAQNQLA
jgi:hypothetical protein